MKSPKIINIYRRNEERLVGSPMRTIVMQNNPAGDGRIRSEYMLGSRSHAQFIDVDGTRIVYSHLYDEQGVLSMSIVAGEVVGGVYMKKYTLDYCPAVEYKPISDDGLKRKIKENLGSPVVHFAPAF